MGRVFRLVLAAWLALFMAGCNEKNYFEPQDIKGEVRYDGELPAPIVEIGYAGATLENGQVITEEGLQKFRLPEGYRFLARRGTRVVASADCKPSIVYDTRDGTITPLDLSRRVVAAMLIPDTTRIAFVLEGNSYGIYDYAAKKTIAKYTSADPALTADIRIANPMMLDQLVLIPTLDGKLVVLNRDTGAKIREIIVGKGEHFNNIIYLQVIGDRLVAATPHRIISVSPKVMDAQTMEIADVVFVADAIYILSKEGVIYHCDTDLKILESRKFPFAHFVGVIYGEFIYVVEKEGYIIATDPDFTVANVFELPDKIETWFYSTGDAFYYDRYYFRLNRERAAVKRATEESDAATTERDGTAEEAPEASESPGLWERIKGLFTPDKSAETTEGADE